MAVTLQDVQNWLQANPGASDTQIATAAREHNVPISLLAQATGGDPNYIQQRFDAALPMQSTNEFLKFARPAMMGSYQANPYLSQMFDSLDRQAMTNFGRQAQMIKSNAIGVGGLGGSRQGVAEALMGEGINNSLMDAKARMYMDDYGGSMNRNLSKYQIDTNAGLGWGTLANSAESNRNGYLLGMRGLDNQSEGLRNNFYTQQRGQDLEAVRTGASVYGLGAQGDWLAPKNATDIYSGYTGYGNTTQNSASGGGATGAVLGGLGAWQLGNDAGWWGPLQKPKGG